MPIEPEHLIPGLRLNRRNFLQYSSAITGGLMFIPFLARSESKIGHLKPDANFWYQKPLRIMHTVLREIDAKSYNSDAVVAYLQKGNYNTLCVNAGGIVDFFQNPLPAANIQSTYTGS